MFGKNMYKEIIFSLFLIILTFNGCQKQLSYEEVLYGRVLPKTEVEKQNECEYIKEEIEKKRLVCQQASIKPCPTHGLCITPIIRHRAKQNIASLENRASIVQCDISSLTVKNMSNENESITEAYKENTQRPSFENVDDCTK